MEFNIGALLDELKWQDFAACADLDTPHMYPADKDTRGVELAKSVCKGCPVRSECLAYAMGRGERFGVWGGLTTTERNNLARRKRRS
jgi:WhiB family transcriptional regulator, redox-sensing transcriptional regulator